MHSELVAGHCPSEDFVNNLSEPSILRIRNKNVKRDVGCSKFLIGFSEARLSFNLSINYCIECTKAGLNLLLNFIQTEWIQLQFVLLMWEPGI